MDESGHGMKVVLDESGIGMKVVLDEIFTFGMKVFLDELVFYPSRSGNERETGTTRQLHRVPLRPSPMFVFFLLADDGKNMGATHYCM